jgi:hypothetical protein
MTDDEREALSARAATERAAADVAEGLGDDRTAAACRAVADQLEAQIGDAPAPAKKGKKQAEAEA